MTVTANEFNRIRQLLRQRIQAVLSAGFAIDATGIKVVTVAHGIPFIPSPQNVQLTVVEYTNVDDWSFDLLKVDSVDATSVTAKIRVSAASATPGATAKLAVLIVHLGETAPADASLIFSSWFVPPPASVPTRRLGVPKEGYTIAPSQLP